ncbi:hypothetical protein [Novosphingobium sp. 9U]|uniref:hypothetical protein n=1 Tax=Novosphingobium sp. 9U TaxID=2653158 RepID=UPI0012EFECE4|nr:hypothetical protein [Novosphingobium sp. 9U]VWX53412.1 hypothetical protein NOVOSPHI9U_50061 [Novosphingobium sp. 9U]
MTNDIEHCMKMIAREEQHIAAAPSSEAAEMHQQKIMLYRAQLQHLRRGSRLDRRH